MARSGRTTRKVPGAPGVARHSFYVGEAFALAAAGGLNAGSDGGRGLAHTVVRQLLVLHAGHFDVYVYAVEEGREVRFW
jgi:hypothetical protein